MGRKFISKKNGKSIFLPAAGLRCYDDLHFVGRDGHYWLSVHSPQYSSEAFCLFFDSDDANMNKYYYRFGGQSVRPVANGSAKINEPTPNSQHRTSSGGHSLDPVIQNLINNMVLVVGGTFTMGATSEQGGDAWDDEKPIHQVTLSSFYLSRYEVTQEEWEYVMGNNPSYFKGANRPIENVSWFDCQEFIRKLNSITNYKFRLPTEAEWEFAARGGTISRGYKYSGSNNLADVAWYKVNSGSKRLNDDYSGDQDVILKNNDCQTHPIGQKFPNELGLYDMSGNVWEWCHDNLLEYTSSSQTNPNTLYDLNGYHPFRGGNWQCFSRNCRVSRRYGGKSEERYSGLGLRLALTY